ncbi:MULTISPECIES: chorismate lyase [Pseudomonas]|uniref:chorismate--pyruvate lyase family protein n=1 Tax=Pseudomonas TaxID=286 RepID=UPI000CD506E7|nr:chorismate lyase [Pseudomonas sp. MWU13-2860]
MPHKAPVPASPAWLTQSRLTTPPDAPTLDWLFDEGSLTRRLTALSDNAFSVTPLFEGWQPLRDDECASLELPGESLGWVREVYLRGHGQPWVFARSVAAQSALREGGLNMDELGSRSLGELLFCDQAFERQAIEVCHYPAPWLPPEHRADHLWGRRSRFNRGPLSLLVAEIFLPSLWHAVSTCGENC